MLLVERHHLLLLLLGLVLVLLLHRRDEGLDLLHVAGADHGLVVQGPEDDADEEGQQDDGDAVIFGPDIGLDPHHDLEDPDADDAPETELQNVFLVRAVGLEFGIDLGADVEGGVLFERLAGREHVVGHAQIGRDAGEGMARAGEDAHERRADGLAAGGLDPALVGAVFRGQDLHEVLVLDRRPVDGERGLLAFAAAKAEEPHEEINRNVAFQNRSRNRLFRLREPAFELRPPVLDLVAAGKGIHAEERHLLLGDFAGQVFHEAGLQAVAAEGDGRAGGVFDAVDEAHLVAGAERERAGQHEAVGQDLAVRDGIVRGRGDFERGEGGEARIADRRGRRPVGEVERDGYVGALHGRIAEDRGADNAGAARGGGDFQALVAERGQDFDGLVFLFRDVRSRGGRRGGGFRLRGGGIGRGQGRIGGEGGGRGLLDDGGSRFGLGREILVEDVVAVSTPRQEEGEDQDDRNQVLFLHSVVLA